MKDNSVKVYCLRFKGVESLCLPSHITWFAPLNDARGDGGCLGRKGQNSDRLTVKLQCSAMFLFSMVSYLSISTIPLWLVYYLKQHFTKWQVFKCTVFINFQFNRQIIKELFKSNLMKFWKISDGFLIYCEFYKSKKRGKYSSRKLTSCYAGLCMH